VRRGVEVTTVAPDGNGVVGVEALARWTHPTRGAVRPDRFIAATLAPGRAPACLTLFRPPALADGLITLGEAA